MKSHSKLSSDKIEGTVFSPRQVRILKIVVVVLGIMLVAGFALVIGTLIYQSSNLTLRSKSKMDARQQKILEPLNPGRSFPALPSGITILSTALDQNRLAITFSDEKGLGIMIVDTQNGTIVSTSRLRLPNSPMLKK